MRPEDEIQPVPVKSRQHNYRGLGPKGYRRSDESIEEDVARVLTEDPYIDASDIDVNVTDGVVTLSGLVKNRHLKRRAEDCIFAIRGIRDIQNNLQALSKSPVASADLPVTRAFEKTHASRKHD
jgi:osmotically-inducible protein OsmY